MKNKLLKKSISIFICVLIAVSGIIPCFSAFAGDGVEGYCDLEIFYDDTNTIVPTYGDDGESNHLEYMYEGETRQYKYELIDSEMPDNGYVKWYSENPVLVDVDQTGLVKAFDSSKGAVIQSWIDNEVKTIPLVGSVMATILEKALFNDYVDLDSMDTEEIVDIVISAFGSDSFLAGYVESYEGQLVDSLRTYLDNINSNIHCQLYDANGTLLDDDVIYIVVEKNEEWYANFLPNGTHITNKSQIETTQAVGNTVQLSAITTPQRLGFGTVYSVKSSSIFTSGKVVATVNDSGLVTFKNTGTVTIVVSPDSEEVIESILKMVNYVYALDNTGTLDTDKIAGILIDYMGLDMNRTVLAGILDVCFAIKDIAGDSADPVQLTATAVEILANLILQMVYNDTITFTVTEAQPITNFDIDGATTVKEGQQIQMSITNVQPSTGNQSDITWSSSDPSIASVDPTTGVITGLDAGGSLGNLSSQTCVITATSAANNVQKSVTLTVTGKTGKYISYVGIDGPDMVDSQQSAEYTYAVYPQRVAESDNLYITWGMKTGEDDDGNAVYSWADEDNEVTDGLGVINYLGEYRAENGGICTIAVKAVTGYYLSNGSFYEISSYIGTKDVTNGIPIDSITITCVDGTSNGDLNRDNVVTINDTDYEYVTIKKGVMEGYAGNGAIFNAQISPSNASNKNLTWVVDNTYYTQSTSDETLTCTVKQNAGHEVADTFNIYAVSADGKIASNVITVCVTRNYVSDNVIDQDTIEVINGSTGEATHTPTFEGSWTGTAYACYKCNWYSSDESVFSVETKTNDNRDALITANDVGTATLYCVTADGGLVSTATVVVKPDKEYLQSIVDLCEGTVIARTPENKKLYQKYMKQLDLAYYVLYDEDMASQDTCDTYAKELLTAFYKIGGFVGVGRVEILDKSKNALGSDYVTVSVGSTTNYKNCSYNFNYELLPKNAMYQSVEWTSSNSSISVDKNGKCTPTSNDSCTALITCTVTDYMGTVTSDSVQLTFARTPVTGVTLDTSEIVGGKVGETKTIKATVSPSSLTNSASCTQLKWESSDENVATVDSNGVVTFVYGGDCEITCTTLDGGYSAVCAVNVVTNYDPLQTLINQYDDLQLNEVNYYPDTWETFSEAKSDAQAMINKGGYSQKEVDAMYSRLENAYNGLKKYNYIQKVELYLDGEATSDFYQYDLSLLKEGISYKNAQLDLKVRLYPNNASYATVSWESSTTNISVTSEGVCSPTVQSSCYGLITCTVTDHFGNSFSDDVWVSFAYYPVTALVLSDNNIVGEKGATYQLACTVEPTGTSVGHIGAASIQDYYWESDDEEVATVDENGLVTFVGAGSTKVRAVSYDGGISAECSVSTDGDRSVLKAAVDEYKDVDYTQYEYAYAQKFKTAYANAEDALTNLSLKQNEIDEVAEALLTAGSEMTAHPYINVEAINLSYTTYKKELSGSTSQVASSTIGSNDSLSINLSSGYKNWNNYNYVTINATPSPTDAMYKNLAWNVDSTKNMNVSISGSSVTCTPTDTDNGGWATITVTTTDDYGKVFSRTINVVMSDKIATGLTVSPTSLSMLATDASYNLTYSVSGSPEFSNITWTSSDESVVKVDNGTVTPVDKGTAKITAKTFDGGYTCTINVTVSTDFSTLADKVVEYGDLINDVKDSYQYTEESLDALSEQVASAKVIVDENKATQAEVNAQLEALNNAYNSLESYVMVTGVNVVVDDSQTAVTTPNEGYVRYTGNLLSGKTIQLSADLSPVSNAKCKTVTWTSSNDDITVDSYGLVKSTTISAKYAVITCTVTDVYDNEYSSSIVVSFVKNAVTQVEFSSTMVYGAPQETKQITPDLNTGSTIASAQVKTCSYTSSNEDVATVDGDGNITFVSQGEAVITCTSMDGGFVGTITAYTTWDTTALQEAIATANDITYTDYAYEQGMAFKTAYDTANEVYKNVYATQAEIDEACYNLQTAMTNLEGNEFVAPTAQILVGDTQVVNNGIYEVDSNNCVTFTYSIADGGMYKNATWSADSTVGATATVNGDSLVVEKTDDTASATITLTVTDDYDRETTYTYNVNLADQIINVESITLTVNGEEVDGAYTAGGYSRGYTDYTALSMGYIINPTDASQPVSVQWASSNERYITVDENGNVELTSSAKLLTKSTATITCTITNADGSTVTQSVDLTISRS